MALPIRPPSQRPSSDYSFQVDEPAAAPAPAQTAAGPQTPTPDEGEFADVEQFLHGITASRGRPGLDAFLLQRHVSTMENASAKGGSSGDLTATEDLAWSSSSQPPRPSASPARLERLPSSSLVGNLAPLGGPFRVRTSESIERRPSAVVGSHTAVVSPLFGAQEPEVAAAAEPDDEDSDADSVAEAEETDRVLQDYLEHHNRRKSIDASASATSAGAGGGTTATTATPGDRLRKAVFLAIEKERAAKRLASLHSMKTASSPKSKKDKAEQQPPPTEKRSLDWEFLARWQRSHLKDKGGGNAPIMEEEQLSSSSPPPDSSTGPFRAKPKYQRRPGLPGPRFVLHSPNFLYPETSTSFSFTPDLLKSQPWFWIDILNVTDGEMFMFSRVFGLHPLTSEDIIEGRARAGGIGQAGAEGREKLEVYPGYYFILVRALEAVQDEFKDEEDEIRGVNLNVIVSIAGDSGEPNWILSFHSRPLPVIAQVYSRLSSFEGYGISTGTHWLAYALLDAVADSFTPHVQSTDLEVAHIDDSVIVLREQSQEDVLRRIIRMKKKVMTLSRLLAGKPGAIKHIRRRLLPFYSSLGISELALYLSDVGDNVVGLLSSLQYQEATLVRAHGTYLARVQIEIQETSNESNALTNKLTIIASVLVPLNLVLGLWSLNTKVPWQFSGIPGTDGDTYWPFVGFCLLIIVVVLGTALVARWKNMI